MLNLHSIVNPLISRLHPNVAATLYRSTGQKNVKGTISQTYAVGEAITVQAQSEGPTTLNMVNKVGQEEVTRKLYLFSDDSMTGRVAGIVRPETRNGDFIQIGPDERWYAGTWWLVLGPVEDFSRAGWQCVRATMQVKGPDFSKSEWYAEGGNG
ncbi:MAG: hypothetical protein LBV79_10295 [Candidatus Adiutrix sp.]|jgi:hypothetical protein|nr:hypothetical protein [Candidatus Adiutrix sp.]